MNTPQATMLTIAARMDLVLPGDRTIGRIADRTSGKANRWSKRASAAASTADRGVPGRGRSSPVAHRAAS